MCAKNVQILSKFDISVSIFSVQIWFKSWFQNGFGNALKLNNTSTYNKFRSSAENRLFARKSLYYLADMGAAILKSAVIVRNWVGGRGVSAAWSTNLSKQARPKFQ